MIGIVIATETEFKNIWRDAFEKVIDVTHKSSYRTYLVKLKNINKNSDPGAVLVLSGVGKVDAACATQYLIDKYYADRIINVGVCGATVEAFNKCKSMSIDRVINGDFNIAPVDGENTIQPFIVNQGLDHKYSYTHPLYTQDHFETNTGREGYFDMEGFAVASVCTRNGVEFELVKSVTDVIGSGIQSQQYDCNMETACKWCADKLIEVMNIEKR